MTDFGRDTSCTTSIRTGRLSTGVRLVAEAAYRRLTTPRGMLRGGEAEANYGIDLAGLVGTVTNKSTAAALEGRVRGELRKDERIQSANITVDLITEGPAVTLNITVEAVTGEGPFTLRLAASAVTVELLGIETGGPA